VAETETITRGAYANRQLPLHLFLVVFITVFISFFSSGVKQPDTEFPALTGRVVDAANILDEGTVLNLTNISRDLQAKTSAQMVVATIPDLKGVPIEDYGYRLGRAWGIGDKDRDDGVLLIVAPNDREVRIEVGYGLEGVLTDALSSQIIQETILPAFRNGQMTQGISNGAAQISRVIIQSGEGKPQAVPSEVVTQPAINQTGGYDLVSIALTILAVLCYGFPLRGLANWLHTRRDAAYAAELITVAKAARGNRFGGPWGGGGSSGGGGFSGGGGSFGGGGSSGRW